MTDPIPDRATFSQTPAGRESAGATSRSDENPGLIGRFTYSGADIKLVVHMPWEERDQEENPRAAELRREYEETQRDLERVASISAATNLSEIRDQMNQLDRAMSEREDELIGIAALPLPLTPEQEARQNELYEENLADQEMYDSLETTYQDANSANQRRAELEESSNSLRRQVEALQSEELSSRTRTKVLAEVSTLSYSIYREKYPVRPLGTVYPRTYTRGPRTISGSMVFATFDRHIFHEFFEAASYRSTGVGDIDRFRYTSFITDQLPPLDVSIVFANEYGNFSWMGIFGVEFQSEGMTMSIEDLFMEGVAQWVARDIDLIRHVAERPFNKVSGAWSVGQDVTGTSLTNSDLGRRIRGRLDPWI